MFECLCYISIMTMLFLIYKRVKVMNIYDDYAKKDIDIKNLRIRIKDLEEENRKQKLHIEAKDKAYTALLKDYEEIKEDRKKILDKIEAEIERFKAFRNR